MRAMYSLLTRPGRRARNRRGRARRRGGGTVVTDGEEAPVRRDDAAPLVSVVAATSHSRDRPGATPGRGASGVPSALVRPHGRRCSEDAGARPGCRRTCVPGAAVTGRAHSGVVQSGAVRAAVVPSLWRGTLYPVFTRRSWTHSA